MISKNSDSVKQYKNKYKKQCIFIKLFTISYETNTKLIQNTLPGFFDKNTLKKPANTGDFFAQILNKIKTNKKKAPAFLIKNYKKAGNF